jgi:uncharacterized protein (DUF1697 family)
MDSCFRQLQEYSKIERNHSIKLVIKFFKNVAVSKYLGTIATENIVFASQLIANQVHARLATIELESYIFSSSVSFLSGRTVIEGAEGQGAEENILIKRDDATGGWEKLHSAETNDL